MNIINSIIQRNEIKNAYYLVVGANNTDLGNRDNIIYTGSIFNDRLMALTYSAADFFILPSKEDNLPNTMLESIACGTPVISFPIGDTKELLEDSKCGTLANEINTEFLDLEIKRTKNKEYNFNRDQIVGFGRDNFNMKKQVVLYTKIYNNI